MTSGWPPTVSPPVQTKWRDEAHWGCHFLTPLKGIQLFLLAKRFCSLAKPALVTGICQYVNGFTVFQQLLRAKHMPHPQPLCLPCVGHMADRGAGGGAPGQQLGSPRSHPGPETGERTLGEDQQILGSGSWPPFHPHPGKVMRILVSGEGTDLENMSPLRCGSCPLTREPICPTVPEITRRLAEECPLSRAHLDRR